MSDRVRVILQARVAGSTEDWVWRSRYKGKRIGAAIMNRRWVRAREVAGLSMNLVLYCVRQVMNAVGHRDVKSATVYPHADVEIVRDALKARHISRPNLASGMLILSQQSGGHANSVGDRLSARCKPILNPQSNLHLRLSSTTSAYLASLCAL